MRPAISSARAINRFPHLRLVLSLGLLILFLPPRGSGQEKPAVRQGAQQSARRAPLALTGVVRFTDDRIQEFALEKVLIRLETPYGKLLIPIADIRSIDFATRIPDADARRADAAVAGLRSAQYRVRRAAEAELLKLRAKAAPALHRAMRFKDLEVVARARMVLNKLSRLVSPDQLEVRPYDLVRTRDSQIAGRLDGTALTALALPAGKALRQLLPLSDLRSLAFGIDPRSLNALPDPGTLQTFARRIHKTFWFKVKGSVNGVIWGTKVYTSDSPLAAVAVHAGILKPGQTGVVQVKIVAPPAAYQGSTQNGVTSQPWGAWPGAYELIRK
jgi:hypothetical protein